MFIFSEDKTVSINSNYIRAFVIAPKKDNSTECALIAVFEDFVKPVEEDSVHGHVGRIVVMTGPKQSCINLIQKLNSKGVI